jgi:uncharacterized protein YceH (UPF0502 family)
MKTIYVIFNPEPGTLARCYDEPIPGAVKMSEEEFIAWRDKQPVSEERPETAPPTLDDRLAALEADNATLKAKLAELEAKR